MKKTFILLAIMAYLAVSQAQDCVNCSNNTVDATKFASALGEENISTELSSFASGRLNEATGWYSTALGYSNKALGHSTFSAGAHNLIQGMGSVGIGLYLNALQSKSFVIGTGANYSSPLINNIGNSLMIGFGSSKPTLFVGTATGSSKTGKIGIGDVTDPQAKLHIKLDLAENTAIRIEPLHWLQNHWAEIQFGDEQYAIRGTHNKGIGFYSPFSFVFNTGNVGIGVGNPSEKLEVNGNIKTEGSISVGEDIFIEDFSKGIVMKSPNGQCWRATVSDDGNFILNHADCSGFITIITQPSAYDADAFRIFPNPTSGELTIETGQEIINGRVSIFSAEGRLLYSEAMNGLTARIDISHLQSGVYIVNIEGGGRLIKSQQVIMN